MPFDAESKTEMEAPLDPKLIALIRCPLTMSTLSVAPKLLVSQMNDQVENGTLCYQVGEVVESRIEAGLVNADGSILFPIRNGIVILVVERAIGIGATAG